MLNAAPTPNAHALEVDGVRVAAVGGVRRVVDESAWKEPENEDDPPPEPTYIDVGPIVVTVTIVVAAG